MRLQDFTITDWLPAGVSLDEAITVLAGLATLTTVLACGRCCGRTTRSSGVSKRSGSAKKPCGKALLQRHAEAASARPPSE